MKWTELGWPVEAWERGIPYDKWRLEATTTMIEHYAAKRGQQEEPPKRKIEKKTVKGAAVFGNLFGKP
jgi:hypothetical protein